MPQSANAGLRAAVEKEIAELEDLCGTIERALLARDWDAFADAMADSRRVTHAMTNAMEAAAPARDAAFDEAIFGRAKRVHAIRENQLARLRTLNGKIAERIVQIGKVRRLSKQLGKSAPAPRLGALDDLR